MGKSIARGVWPTMITPFTETNRIDYGSVEKLVEWYIARGVAGIFAVCQSSEMFYLSEQEMTALAAFVVRCAAGRVGVVASGHTAECPDDQIRMIHAMAETGAQNIVLLPNRLAREGEGDDVVRRAAEYLLAHTDPAVVFGLYECPYPYKRLLSPALVSFFADTGRFVFLKDTCCNASQVAEKIRAGRGVVQVFNANCAQLLETLRAGASGFSGVMANFHPELYAWLCAQYANEPEQAERVQAFLGVASALESREYPVNAKRYLRDHFFPEMSDYTRSKDRSKLAASFDTELAQLAFLQKELSGGFLPQI